MKEGEKKRRGSNMRKKKEKNPQRTLFWTNIKKKIAHPLFGAWSLLLVHIWYTPSEWPKGFKNAIFDRNWMMKM